MIDLDNVSEEYMNGLRDMAALAYAVADADRSYKDGGVPPVDFFQGVVSDIDMWREEKLIERLGANEEEICYTKDSFAKAIPEPEKLKVTVQLPRKLSDEEDKIVQQELDDFESKLDELLGPPAEP